MDVIKVGGSLMENARDAMDIIKSYEVLVIPGGGVFADAVRRMQKETGLDDATAHRMAILAMDEYGLMLSGISEIPTYESLDEVQTPCIFLPSQLLRAHDPFTPAWDVTSDTIACYIADLAGADRFIILTDVDGILVDGKAVDEISAAKLQKLPETCVDKALAGHLLEYKMDCQVVNGKDKSAVEMALNGEQTGTIVRGM